MITVNEMSRLKCNKREILEPFLIVLSSFAPHLSEELWSKLGHKESISLSKYPKYNDKFLDEDEFEYPIMINGKLRTKIKFSLEANGDEVKKQVVQNDIVIKWIKNENVKKIIFVPKKNNKYCHIIIYLSKSFNILSTHKEYISLEGCKLSSAIKYFFFIASLEISVTS